MIIDGIEYFVVFFIDDATDGSELEDLYFHNFEEFNQFIRDNKNNPKYHNVNLSYSFVESVNGNPGSFSWSKPLEFREISDKEIQFEIQDYKDFQEENSQETMAANEWSKQIHYQGEDEDYQSKREHLKDISYVCPSCIRVVEDCRCKLYPYYLVQIDTLILPIIRLLNEKGYITTGCCAGHPNTEREHFIIDGIYICFDQDYGFLNDYPEGAVYEKVKNCIRILPKEDDLDNLEYFQQRALDDLLEWAELLDYLD